MRWLRSTLLLAVPLFWGLCLLSGTERALAAEKGSGSTLALKESEGTQASGPLRVSKRNPRFFEDAQGRIVFLTGSHTFNTLVDQGTTDPPAATDFEAHLRFLTAHHHNFIRLWPSMHFQTGEERSAPLPWLRTGPGLAHDKKPKLDLNKLNPEYFDRLRARIIAAGKRNIYVGIMLFESWYRHEEPTTPYDVGHAFHKDNNLSGINGGPTSKGVGYTFLSLDDPAITAIQEAYVRKIIDTVNDLDNVLYEISNESRTHSIPWQYHMIKFVRNYERGKPKQHPIGMTDPCEPGKKTNADLFESDADWISPHDTPEEDYLNNPPAADGRKVIVSDTDHLEGRWVKGTVALWVWKSLCRGINTIYMDIDDPTATREPQRELLRRRLGDARRYAQRMNLAEAVPCNDLASTNYCLSDKKSQFLVYLPEGGKVQVNLTAAPGSFNVEWFNPTTRETSKAAKITGGTRMDLASPFIGDTVLYLWKQPASGPLRVSKRNPRFFEDAEGRVVYLTGSHTFPTLSRALDYGEYLAFLHRHNHNFIRMWANADTAFWLRTGPGESLDGKPKVDLTQFDQKYFDRMRERVIAAGKQGIYVSVMLFEGWAMHRQPKSWQSHPFNRQNNINGINGDPQGKGVGYRVYMADIPEITALQEAYVRKVIDTVGDLDNVLYEIINEGAKYSEPWQYHMINYIHQYEKSKPKQHVVGMTYPFEEARTAKNAQLFESPAEWISPHSERDDGQNYNSDPPAADGRKVIIADTDHLGGDWGEVPWVWKSLCRGIYPIFMDPYHGDSGRAHIVDPEWDAVRKNMGYSRRYAERMNLAEAVPCNNLASTKYCLSDKKSQFLIYLPQGPNVRVNLTTAPGSFNVEWFNPSTGKTTPVGKVAGGKPVEFASPFTGDAVLYLWKE